MSENNQPQPNSTEAREPDGTLKDQGLNQEVKQEVKETPKEEPKPEGEKPEGEKKEEAKDKSLVNEAGKEKKEEKAAAPEKYELKAPEGATLDPKLVEAATPLFKEAGLSNEAAQKFVDFYNEQAKAIAEASVNEYRQTRKEWRDTIKADTEVGPKLQTVLTDISRAIDNIAPNKELANQFREAMDLTGAGDHPAFIKLFNHIATVVNEGKPVPGGKPSPHGQGNQASGPGAQAMFPTLPSAAQPQRG